jgi:hypothetical protein
VLPQASVGPYTAKSQIRSAKSVVKSEIRGPDPKAESQLQNPASTQATGRKSV